MIGISGNSQTILRGDERAGEKTLECTVYADNITKCTVTFVGKTTTTNKLIIGGFLSASMDRMI